MLNLFLFIIPIMLIVYTQAKITNTYAHYKKIKCMKGFTGEMVARIILEKNHLHDVDVNITNAGQLSDYYDPRMKSVHLSNDVYYGNSIASIAVAAHEVGHALQHAENYAFLSIRNRLLPHMQLVSQLGWGILLLGFISNSSMLVNISFALLVLALLFQTLTLPIELNASRRAKIELKNYMIVSCKEEEDAVEQMLKAAAFTYIASLISSIAYLMRIILINNRD